MSKPVQLTLDLPHRPALSGEDFFVAPANAQAIDWIDRWPDWPGPGIVIHGDRGCGKSHLVGVFASRSGARLLNADALADTEFVVSGTPSAYVIDDADLAVAQNVTTSRALFHLFNLAKREGRKLMLTGRTPAARWQVPLADLSSRLKTLDQVMIAPPDDALLGVLLVKQFADRQLRVAPAVIHYLTARMERSTDAVIRIVDALDRSALSRKRSISITLARSVLDEGSRDL